MVLEFIKKIDDNEQKNEQLLQIVNWNVENQQYIIAGSIDCLRKFQEFVDSYQYKKNAEYYKIDRTNSTILLEGIDVPFHSRLLVSYANEFERVLDEIFENVVIKKERLENSYIPNLTGKIFEMSREYLQLIKENIPEGTVDRRLELLIEQWDDVDEAHKIKTMVILLIKYQFCCPVRWIDCQKYYSTMDNVVEMGPSNVLLNMLSRTNSYSHRMFYE